MTGKSIALQIKTGASFFKEKNQVGWVFRGSSSHLNYYLNHDIPVIIVLVDEIKTKAYWCLCDASKTEKAGNNWKITVPFEQKLIKKYKKELMKHTSPIIDYVSQMESFWEINSMIRESGRIVFIVGREEIEPLEYSSLVMAFERLTVSQELLLSSKGKIDILIHGYDSDNRELRDIKEVKEWVSGVLSAVEGLCYFLVADDDAQFLRLLQLCTYSYKALNHRVIIDGLLVDQLEIDLESGMRTLELIYDNLNLFCDKHNLSLDINKEITYNVAEVLTGLKFPNK